MACRAPVPAKYVVSCWADAGRRGGRFLDLDLSAGYDGGPAVGPGGRGSTSPRSFLPCSSGRVCAVQVGGGIPWTRCRAVTIPCAQGEVAAIFRVLRRPPRTRRAAACRTR